MLYSGELDAFDDATATAQRFPLLKIDLFDEAPETATTPLLTRVQQRIRDLEPLAVRVGRSTFALRRCEADLIQVVADHA